MIAIGSLVGFYKVLFLDLSPFTLKVSLWNPCFITFCDLHGFTQVAILDYLIIIKHLVVHKSKISDNSKLCHFFYS